METTLYQYVRLGMTVEYLRGIATISIMQAGSLAEFPALLANMPNQRYNVLNVVSAIKALFAQLEQLGLTESLAAAEPLKPMTAEMEQALAQTRVQAELTLRDHFAQKLVMHAQTIALAIKEETAKRKV